MVAVPGEVLRCRPVPGIGGKSDPATAHAGKEHGRVAGLGEVPLGDEHGIVVGQGPETVVEEPVGVRQRGMPLRMSSFCDMTHRKLLVTHGKTGKPSSLRKALCFSLAVSMFCANESKSSWTACRSTSSSVWAVLI